MAAPYLLLDRTSVEGELRRRGLIRGEAAIRELGGGVSNQVWRVDSGAGALVVKQALPKLRVAEEWLCDPARIHQECSAIRQLADCLPPGTVPRVIADEPGEYWFAMSAAPEEARTWKSFLLAGEYHLEVAELAGQVLGMLAATTLDRPEPWAQRFPRYDLFDDLRLDPYYRAAARRHPDLSPAMERVIAETGRRRRGLVHGDYSPKNVLLWREGKRWRLLLIDFEVCHYGDVSFDPAFMLNHLILKMFYRPEGARGLEELAQRFWDAYAACLPEVTADVQRATMEHLGPLMLARVDGKSPVEYLQNENVRLRVRQCARALIQNPQETVTEVLAKAREASQ